MRAKEILNKQQGVAEGWRENLAAAVPAVLKHSDFRIPTETYSVENRAKWSAGGDDAWFYKGTDTR